MKEAVAAFLGVALLFYSLLGGADFGAGILELFAPKQQRDALRKQVTRALGPVWEANHIWLILAVVIVFTGFPKFYVAISNAFHIPLTGALFGIIARGCAFAFRHYDPYADQLGQTYSRVFAVGSLVTPFCLGLVLGGCLGAQVLAEPTTFAEAFVTPWLSPFALAMGVFVCCLFAYVGGVFLIAETEEVSLRPTLVQAARWGMALAMLSGLAVFALSWWGVAPLAGAFLSHPWSLACMGLASVLAVPIWRGLPQRQPRTLRALVSAQVGCVLVGWFLIQLPMLLPMATGPGLTLENAAAPDATLRAMLVALVCGSLLIFPALYFLFRVFKSHPGHHLPAAAPFPSPPASPTHGT